MKGGLQEIRKLINAQKPELLDGVQVTDYIGQRHKTPWVRGSGLCWELFGWRKGRGDQPFLCVLRTVPPGVLRTFPGLFPCPSVRPHGKVAKGVIPPQAQELNHSSGPDVIFSCPRSRSCDH